MKKPDHIITCVYCGQAYPENTPTHGADVAVLTEHIKTCKKHPMRELEQRLAESKITKHSGDCRWWSFRICDCGYLMRANSGDFGEPSEQVTKDWLEHSANCQQVKDTPLVQILEQRLKESEARTAEMRKALEHLTQMLRYVVYARLPLGDQVFD